MLAKIIKRVLPFITVMSFLLGCSNNNGNNGSTTHVHIYSELVKEVNATCVDDGLLAHYKCLECDKLFDVDKNEISESDLIIPARGHKYSNLYHVDETTHSLMCNVCGFVDETSAVNHTFDKRIKNESSLVNSATCIKGSVYHYSCICGAIGEETFEENNATGHNPNIDWTYDETYHWHGCLNNAEEQLDKESHVFDKQIATADYLKEHATCEHGNIYYYSCECGAKSEETFDDNLIIEHKGSHYDYRPFTKENNGTNQFWECDMCHEIYMLDDGVFSIEKVRFYNSKTLQIELPTFIDIGKNFLATDPGFNILQDGSSQQAGWFGYATSSNNESTISVNFNNESNSGDVFYILKNSLITDKNDKQYRLDKDYKFIYENDMWEMETVPTIPNGSWEEKGIAPLVSDDDIRSILYTVDLYDANLIYSDKNHIHESIDLELVAEDGVILDTSSLIIKRNGEQISISAQYYNSHTLSINLGFDDAEAGDTLVIAKDSVFKLVDGDKIISRKIKKDVAYLYDGAGEWRKAKIVEFGLPSITHVQWGMVLLQDENYFKVAKDTDCFYTGSVKTNGQEYNNIGVPQSATLGLYFNNLTITEGFIFNIAKGTYFDSNNILIITLNEYNVLWNGNQWEFIN